MPVGVDHPRHHDAAGRVDLAGALGYVEVLADRLDPVADDQDVAGLVDRVGVVHRQDGASAQDDRVGHGSSLVLLCVFAVVSRRAWLASLVEEVALRPSRNHRRPHAYVCPPSVTLDPVRALSRP